MRYWTVTLLALAVFAGSVLLFCVKLTTLLDVGTCASGNQPFVVARECPAGTETDSLLIAASVVGLLVAAGIGAARGSRPGTSGGSGAGRLVLWGWALFFTVTGIVSLAHALTSDVIGSDGKTGGIIVGATFLIMGVPVLAFCVWFGTLRGDRRGPTSIAGGVDAAQAGSASTLREACRSTVASRGSPPPTATTATGSGDPIGQLERLQRLLDSGALTRAEFERQKARVLGS